MSYGYVYAPVSGEIWALDYYCKKAGHPAHPTVGGSGYDHPIDLGEGLSDGTVIRFRGTSNIKSIKVEHIGNVCATDPSPWTDGVKVHMYTGYNATGTLVGTVLYGHLKERLADGTVKNKPSGSWGQYLGKLPHDCNCGCSIGIHVHMECKGGSRNSLSCEQQVYTSTWFYRWTMPV